MHELCVRVSSSSFSLLPLSASHRKFLILECRRHGSGNEKHSNKLPNAKVAHTHLHTHTNNTNERVGRRSVHLLLFWIFSHFYFFYLLRAHSFVQTTVDVKYEQRTAPTTSQLKWRNQIYTQSEGEKLWIAKRMICSQIGEKIKWYFQLLSHKNKSKMRKEKRNKYHKNDVRRTDATVDFFHFSSVCHNF